ncbi:MAG: DsbA family protein [Solirubrobacteraceae bacterium]
MGELVSLEPLRQRRAARETSRALCYVDLSCPFSYLAAERVERSFARVTWRLASTACVERRDPAADGARADAVRAAAERRAAQLRLPLQWPDRFPDEVPAAMRAAAYAAEQGRGGVFVLAAGRLAFCGGFDLEDPEILAEAAAAAGIGLDACLQAARDTRRDAAIEVASRRLLAVGADRLPVLRVGRSLLWGERRISAYLAGGRGRDTAVTR